ncbi:hypothetical protein BC939DRAFT_455999 [Gamsiella multidivaricata]|uniref:uncharacterized protein n=1 Tax=Gamsiella multidivaricata TaxID=101098 RepID=UPI002220D8BF|nr:uncharacterized protein BC939DRAFT_455999 [Gamsiella multidivaricata]KAI7821175.1 hypothetical protein BC939DRAFT_455999 [Gamsiella multidivaricata]
MHYWAASSSPSLSLSRFLSLSTIPLILNCDCSCIPISDIDSSSTESTCIDCHQTHLQVELPQGKIARPSNCHCVPPPWDRRTLHSKDLSIRGIIIEGLVILQQPNRFWEGEDREVFVDHAGTSFLYCCSYGRCYLSYYIPIHA